MTRKTWTRADVEALGVVTDVPTAGAVLGLSRGVSYDLARRGELPVRVLRLGARLRVPVADLLAVLDPAASPVPTGRT